MIPKMTQLSNAKTGLIPFDTARQVADTAIAEMIRKAVASSAPLICLDAARALCFAWLALLEEVDGTREKLERLAAQDLARPKAQGRVA